MKNNTIKREQLYFVSRLGIERCRQQLAHLHALMHLGDKDNVLAAAIAGLLASLEHELSSSSDLLDNLANS